MCTSFYQGNEYKLILLNLNGANLLKPLIQSRLGIDSLPLTHYEAARAATFVDYKNIMGKGHQAIFDVNGYDKSHLKLISLSIEDFLNDFLEKL